MVSRLEYPECPTCHSNDQVEDSVAPEKWDGYCYRCLAPFKSESEIPAGEGFMGIEAQARNPRSPEREGHG